jgi:hypothetical protein
MTQEKKAVFILAQVLNTTSNYWQGEYIRHLIEKSRLKL